MANLPHCFTPKKRDNSRGGTNPRSLSLSSTEKVQIEKVLPADQLFMMSVGTSPGSGLMHRPAKRWAGHTSSWSQPGPGCAHQRTYSFFSRCADQIFHGPFASLATLLPVEPGLEAVRASKTLEQVCGLFDRGLLLLNRNC
jgi:hypothetical protein